MGIGEIGRDSCRIRARIFHMRHGDPDGGAFDKKTLQSRKYLKKRLDFDGSFVYNIIVFPI